jgi:hypothetical protein
VPGSGQKYLARGKLVKVESITVAVGIQTTKVQPKELHVGSAEEEKVLKVGGMPDAHVGKQGQLLVTQAVSHSPFSNPIGFPP